MSSTSPHRRPTRPTPAVYRRRRLVALLVLLLLLAGVTWGVTLLLGRGDAADAAPAADGADQPTAEATPTAQEPASGEVVPCLAQDVDTVLVLDPPAPAPGSAVRFRVTLRNTGEQPCLLDAGPASLVASVTSGSDPVWSSAHCADDATYELLLDTGAESAVTVTWNGRRSAEGCPGDQRAAAAGTYRVSLSLAGEPLGPERGRVFTVG
ncbi:hypothetical protein [uncultured Georgenia sp.]|uniref:hypothetical protein n=1 Tax=uncultured Georgenia sp. TaxID=378209 RepID=UPI002627A4AE|nr:hypothetical protein [uncultured Georgenia sp.]